MENGQEEDDVKSISLILLNRDMDLNTVLVHPWHYLALIYDLFVIEDELA